jgi:hypothetical protein
MERVQFEQEQVCLPYPPLSMSLVRADSLDTFADARRAKRPRRERSLLARRD